MSMKTSAVWADDTFESNTAPLMGPLEDCARRAAELGYDALSLTVNRPGELDADQVNRTMKKYGLAVSGLATGRIYTVDGLGLGMGDQNKRQAAVDRMLEHAQLCARLGEAKLIVGAIRGWTRDAGGQEAYQALFRASLEEILARAESLGVQVVLEAISRIDSDAYCSVAETAAFIRSFRSGALRLQLDSIHLHTNGETDFYGEILKAGDLIGQVDISDVDRMAPDGNHFDFPLLMKGLQEANYRDYLVFEYRADPPENAAKAGLDYIRGLM